MFHGVLVTNAFLRTDKFVEHYEWIKRSGQSNMILPCRFLKIQICSA